MTAENKYETSLHINLEFMEKCPNINSNKKNNYAGLNFFIILMADKPPSSRIIEPQVGFICMPSIMAIQ